jgi:adenine-specific DNA-methyltransferase
MNSNNEIKEFQELLRDLFEFESSDLDFGIYRILNQRRERIDKFIEEDLVSAVEEGLSELSEMNQSSLEDKLQEKKNEVIENIGDDAFTPEGGIKTDYREFPIAQDYLEVREELKDARNYESAKKRIFNDLYKFFARYYEDGDFVPKRRFSSREPKYHIPYNGEELMFHWANKEQYYVKSSEHFTNYSFNVDEYHIKFELEDADVPQDNVKGDDRYFVLGQEPIEYDSGSKTLTVTFQYRKITEEEADAIVDTYNEVSDETRKSFVYKTQKILCTTLEKRITDKIDDPGVKEMLIAETEDEGGESVLYRQLRKYTSENTRDYFVHKNLEKFLSQELDFFIQNEVLDVDELIEGQDISSSSEVLRAKVIKKIANKIIQFLSQVEDFQKRLFEKRKFIVQTDYLITLDQIPEEFYDEILSNSDQIEKWKELYNIDEWDKDLAWRGDFDEKFLENHPYLMVDTQFFEEEFKHEILARFDDLEDSTDGILLHGENFQVVNLLKNKYGSEIDYIYIDPPYNTVEGTFAYKNNYKHSSWLSMMYDRLSESRSLLTEGGVIGAAIDDEETNYLRTLMDKSYGKENYISTLAIEVNPAGQNLKDNVPARSHDYFHVYSKNAKQVEMMPRPLTEEEKERYPHEDDEGRFYWDNLRRRGGNSRPSDRPNQWYPIYVDLEKEKVSLEEFEGSEEVLPIDPKGEKRIWRVKEETAEEEIESGEISVIEKKGEPNIVKKTRMPAGKKPKTLWYDSEYSATTYGTKFLNNILGTENNEFSYPKSIHLVEDCLRFWAQEDATVLDFFAGSGTTGHAVMNLNDEDGGDRDYILAEMGEYFDTVLKPRLIRSVFSESWSNGVPEDRNGRSHMIKYHRIESYEDALNNIELTTPEDPQQKLIEERFDDYIEGYMLDFEAEGSPSLLNTDAFHEPFNYKLQVKLDEESRQLESVDLVETFHYLLGVEVKSYSRKTHQDRKYIITECELQTEDGVESVLTLWRNDQDLDLEKEKEWFEDEFDNKSFDKVYTNSESHIQDSEPVVIKFRERMEEDISGEE